MCGGKTTIQTPAPPAPPSVGQSVQEYVQNLPAIYQAELDYNPKFAASDYALAQEYFPQYTKLMQQTEASLYPETAALQENLAKQAREGMTEGVPDSLRSQYLDTLRSELGPNVGSGIGADYVSRNMINLQKEYNDYYRNLGLSITGRLPLTQTATPGFRQAGEGYNYGQTANNMQQGYGSYSGLYGSMYGANAQMQGSRNQTMGALLGGGVGALGLLGMGRFGGK